MKAKLFFTFIPIVLLSCFIGLYVYVSGNAAYENQAKAIYSFSSDMASKWRIITTQLDLDVRGTQSDQLSLLVLPGENALSLLLRDADVVQNDLKRLYKDASLPNISQQVIWQSGPENVYLVSGYQVVSFDVDENNNAVTLFEGVDRQMVDALESMLDGYAKAQEKDGGGLVRYYKEEDRYVVGIFSPL
jgi:hypothetical protein